VRLGLGDRDNSLTGASRCNVDSLEQERLLDMHPDGDITTEQFRTFRTKRAELEGACAADTQNCIYLMEEKVQRRLF
jgi:hypothetical protein